MPHVSADMDDDRKTDYSSFEYQHLRFSPTIDSQGESFSTFQEAGSLDVLEDRGGLDANEVAELVYLRRNVSIVPQDFNEASPTDQGSIQGEISFGVNLDSPSDLHGDTTNDEGDMTEIGRIGIDEADEEAAGLQFSLSADEVFDTASVVLTTGHDDSNSGGAFDVQKETRELNFRALLGAGPVLDSGDSLSLVSEIKKENAVIGRAELRYDVHCIFDIATVDDAGRRFGIPG